jgi:hypothetical protein
MIKHTYLKNLTLNVPTSVNSTGKLHLDEDGCIVEELSFEQEQELIDHPDFVTVESGKSQVESKELQSAEGGESNDQENNQGQEEKTADQESGENSEGKAGEQTEDELKEFDTKIVNGKGFIYKKNKADILMWLRHPEIDEKG